jgi:hypothetical protein
MVEVMGAALLDLLERKMTSERASMRRWGVSEGRR